MRTTNVVCPRCRGRGGYDVTTPAELRKARKAAGLTLLQTAERVGASVAYLSQMERGRRAVTERITAAYRRLGGRAKAQAARSREAQP